MGNGGNAPGSVGVASSSAGDAQMTYIPAFDGDLPKGSAAVGLEPGPTSALTRAASASSGPTWICTVYASDSRRAVYSGKNSVEGDGWQSCTGTQTYRIVDGWQGTYHQAVQSLNDLRTTC